MSKFIGPFILAIGLLAPSAALYAQDHPAPPPHVWNDGENDYWHQYLKEQHKKDHDWAKASKREQANYWKWRDQHRDNK